MGINIKVYGFFLVIAHLCLSLPTSAKGADLDHAYQLFLKRDTDLPSLKRAKKIYLKHIKDQKANLISRADALGRYAQLSIFHGEINRKPFGIDRRKSAKIFQSCIDASEYLSPSNIKEQTPQYYYWRSMCIGLWLSHSQSINLFKKGHRFKELKGLVATGKEFFPRFDGYGFNRVEAGIYLRSEKFKAFGIFNPKKALALLEEHKDHEITNYMHYLLMAEAFKHMNKMVLAKMTLRKGINELMDKFENKQIPEDLIADNEYAMRKMRLLLEELTTP